MFDAKNNFSTILASSISMFFRFPKRKLSILCHFPKRLPFSNHEGPHETLGAGSAPGLARRAAQRAEVRHRALQQEAQTRSLRSFVESGRLFWGLGVFCFFFLNSLFRGNAAAVGEVLVVGLTKPVGGLGVFIGNRKHLCSGEKNRWLSGICSRSFINTPMTLVFSVGFLPQQAPPHQVAFLGSESSAAVPLCDAGDFDLGALNGWSRRCACLLCFFL